MGLRSRIRARLRVLFDRFSGDYSAASDRLGDGTTAQAPDPDPTRDRPVRARLVKPRSKPGEDPGEGR